MNKKKAHINRLSTSLALVLGVGMATTSSTAMAVYLDNNDGLGDAGIFQYYTVNSGWQTFIRVINTSDQAVSVKVRFREAANSREVLDFIIFLSPYDVWAGWTDDDANNNDKPGVRTMDTSCLYPIPDSNNTDEGWKTIAGNLLGADFQDRAFKSASIYDDNTNRFNGQSLPRLSEGHLEIIGIAQHDPNDDFGRAVTHNQATGKPSNCSEASNLFEAQEGGGRGSDLENVLAMNGYLINVTLGQGGGFDPDILADFADRSLAGDALATATDPDMDSATQMNGPQDARDKQKGVLGISAVTGGVDEVSIALQRTSVINEWAASPNPENVVSDYYTQWVITFPTKHYYVDLQNDPEPLDDFSPTLTRPAKLIGNGYDPFYDQYKWGVNAGRACEPYRMRIWNREEQSFMFTSPAPTFPVELCYETNVLVFNEYYETEGLNSAFAVTIPEGLLPVDAGGITSQRGWASMDFWDHPADDNGIGIDPVIEGNRDLFGYAGLPVTGFMLSVFNTNSNSTNHTTINSHKYTTHFEGN